MISAHGNRFAGTEVTGARYIVRNNGILLTGGDATYLAGNTAGTAAAGGLYGP